MSLTRTESYQPRLTAHWSIRPGEQAIVYLPGLTNNGDITIKDLLFYLLGYGDVFVINHPLRSYAPDDVVQLVADAVQGYRSIILVASSMGGLLVDPILDEIHRRDIDAQVKIVAPCSLISGLGVALPAAWLARFLYWPITSRPVIRVADWLLGLRDKLPTEQSVLDQKWHLRDHRRSLRGAKASARRAQLEFIATACQPKSTHPEPCIYIRALQVGNGKSDGFVLGSAAVEWQKVFPNTEVLELDNLRHCTLVEQPQAWLSAMRLAFQRLHVAPLAQ